MTCSILIKCLKITERRDVKKKLPFLEEVALERLSELCTSHQQCPRKTSHSLPQTGCHLQTASKTQQDRKCNTGRKNTTNKESGYYSTETDNVITFIKLSTFMEKTQLYSSNHNDIYFCYYNLPYISSITDHSILSMCIIVYKSIF